jgi:hypothetical protein
MAEHIIPNNAGPYRVIKSMAGTPLVTNGRKGKTKVSIPCKSWDQAEDVCRRLNEKDHPGVIQA